MRWIIFNYIKLFFFCFKKVKKLVEEIVIYVEKKIDNCLMCFVVELKWIEWVIFKGKKV